MIFYTEMCLNKVKVSVVINSLLLPCKSKPLMRGIGVPLTYLRGKKSQD